MVWKLSHHAYKRVGKTNQSISSSEIRNLALESKKAYWDELPCMDATLEDIKEEKVKLFLKNAKIERRLDINPEISIEDALEILGLVKEEKLTVQDLKEPSLWNLLT